MGKKTMKTEVVFTICILLFAGLLSASSIGVCNITSETIIYVDDDNTGGPWDGTIEHPYQYIQDGVDNASNGNTVFVLTGTYYEYVLVNKRINLIGKDRNNTFIEGGVTITADWVNLTTFTIQNSSSNRMGIRVTSNHTTIHQNTVVDVGGAISLDGSSYNIIYGNTLIGNWLWGIDLWNSAYNEIVENTISNNWDLGILIGGYSSNNNISDNIINNNDRGFFILGVDNIYISNNTISYNKGEGLYLSDVENSIVSGNDIVNNGGEGLLLKYSINNLIYSNNFADNDIGISLIYSPENNITFNTISNSRFGIWLTLSSDSTIIFRNTLLENILGLYLSDSSQNEITFNTFGGNKQDVFFVNCDKKPSLDYNYWDRPRLLPKPIFGIKNILGLWILKITFDWHPAQEPYKLGV